MVFEQVSDKGHLLSTCVGDTKVGATKGQSFEKTWWVVEPSSRRCWGSEHVERRPASDLDEQPGQRPDDERSCLVPLAG